MKQHRWIFIWSFCFLSTAASIWGSDVNIPHSFLGGTPAYASHVNENFNAVETAVDDNFSALTSSGIYGGTLSTGYFSAYADLSAENKIGTASNQVAAGNHVHAATAITSGTLSTNRYSAYSDLSAEGYLGNASGDIARNNGTLQATLNADLLDGQNSTAFAAASHSHPMSKTQARFSFIVHNITNGSYIGSGAIDTNGSKMNGSANVSAVWNATSQWYEITISGYSYFWTDFHASITPYDEVRSWETGSVSGKLLVTFYN